MILCMLILGLAAGTTGVHGRSSAMEPTESRSRMAEALAEADLVVVATVIGPVDPAPGARARKEREAHWVDVERTLKGGDETGQRLKARPNGLRWVDGQSYVIFLRWLGGDWFEARSKPALPATEANVRAVERAARQQGMSVGPPRVLWMRHMAGWGGGLIGEFSLAADGTFQWTTRVGKGPARRDETKLGRLPDAIAAALLKEVFGPVATRRSGMKRQCILLIALAMVLTCLVAAPQASALVIAGNFTGGAAPGNAAGGGNLVDIFNTAARFWEFAILDAHTVAIDFSWASLDPRDIGRSQPRDSRRDAESRNLGSHTVRQRRVERLLPGSYAEAR